MKPDPLEPAEMLRLLRQQLILAQARIMEVEDERDQHAARLADVDALLTAAQQLADAKLGEAAHHQGVAAAAQTQATSLQTQLTAAAAALTAAQARHDQAAQAAAQAQAALDKSSRELAARLARLEAELATVKSSRSWRWTAWLR